MGFLSWLPIAFLLAGAPLPLPPPSPEVSTQALHEDLATKLKHVDRSIRETEQLISQTRAEKYLPQLQLRLCELYVEKSRYLYHLQGKASTETRLLKQRVVQMYGDLLREHPSFPQTDKVRFYLAHEHRELGDTDEMKKTLEVLRRKHPSSPLSTDAAQILGDIEFEAGRFDGAEKHYRDILESSHPSKRGLALYKMAWIRVNQGKHEEAVTLFESAARTASAKTEESATSLDVRRQALLDMVLSYTENKATATEALAYFEQLAGSRTTYAAVLEKLAARYSIKQQPENWVPVIRRLLWLQPDPTLDLERVQRLYDGVVGAKDKLMPSPTDIRFLVRTASGIARDAVRSPRERTAELAKLEAMSRDLATRLHLAAQKSQSTKDFAAAADAYSSYFEMFRPDSQLAAVQKNHADALHACSRFAEAARAYERWAITVAQDPQRHEAALRGALLSHQATLRPDQLKHLTLFQRVNARSGIKVLGKLFLARYPKADEATAVELSIARAYYDDGETEEAGRRLTAFVEAHPQHNDAVVAAKLALDTFRLRRDFDGLEKTGKRLLMTALPAPFLSQVREQLARAQDDAIANAALTTTKEGGSLVQGLLEAAQKGAGTSTGEKALVAAIEVSAEKEDFAQETTLVQKLLSEYPRSPRVPALLLLRARRLAERGELARAAEEYEGAAKLQPTAEIANAFATAAELWRKGGSFDRSIRAWTHAAQNANTQPKGLYWAEAARTLLDAGGDARSMAQTALSQGGGAKAAWVLLTVALGEGREKLWAAASELNKAVLPPGDVEDSARAAWLLAEATFLKLQSLPQTDLEERIGLVQSLEAQYGRVVSLGSADWGVASVWRLALTYGELASSLDGAGLAEQAQSMRQKEAAAWDTCRERAKALGVFNEARIGCREKSDVAVLPRWQSPTGKVRAQTGPPSLEALGRDYLVESKPGLAELVFSRAIELNPSQGRPHAQLGTALAQQGRWSAAHAAYRKALELDPNDVVAKTNLASLECRFDQALSSKPEEGQLSEDLLEMDSTWRTCHHAVTRR